MLPRLLGELFLLVLPFIAFGLYRLAVRDAEIEGKKAWPITALFLTGIVLAVGFWLFLILREDRSLTCNEPAYTDPATGEIVPARSYECDVEFKDLGVPQNEDPGGRAPSTDDPTL